jgi:hypothetical protein
LPKHWKRLSFRFLHRGAVQTVELTSPIASSQDIETV